MFVDQLLKQVQNVLGCLERIDVLINMLHLMKVVWIIIHHILVRIY